MKEQQIIKALKNFLNYNPERDSLFTLRVIKNEAEKAIRDYEIANKSGEGFCEHKNIRRIKETHECLDCGKILLVQAI